MVWIVFDPDNSGQLLMDQVESLKSCKVKVLFSGSEEECEKYRLKNSLEV